MTIFLLFADSYDCISVEAFESIEKANEFIDKREASRSERHSATYRVIEGEEKHVSFVGTRLVLSPMP